MPPAEIIPGVSLLGNVGDGELEGGFCLRSGQNGMNSIISVVLLLSCFVFQFPSDFSLPAYIGS
jgi:hypothetical protein